MLVTNHITLTNDLNSILAGTNTSLKSEYNLSRPLFLSTKQLLERLERLCFSIKHSDIMFFRMYYNTLNLYLFPLCRRESATHRIALSHFNNSQLIFQSS